MQVRGEKHQIGAKGRHKQKLAASENFDGFRDLQPICTCCEPDLAPHAKQSLSDKRAQKKDFSFNAQPLRKVGLAEAARSKDASSTCRLDCILNCGKFQQCRLPSSPTHRNFAMR